MPEDDFPIVKSKLTLPIPTNQLTPNMTYKVVAEAPPEDVANSCAPRGYG